ncbi:carbohydrate porin [Methylomonas koyamae]|uniref:carbohydrate porin n=1 Tax=Methylomonas koyamae TaxID=702114 RepID=UPI002872FE3D|nr:carbohydrate porin [Methylomonas koyamae]WNB77393.1 carbohydrate porin [Methylomonas koyamae]
MLCSRGKTLTETHPGVLRLLNFSSAFRSSFGKRFAVMAWLAFSEATVHAAGGDRISLMELLDRQGWHDIQDERWNAYGQATYISSWKPAFPAAYTNLNGTPHSLSPQAERSFTGTVTAYFGLKAWRGGEIYLAPEMISELPLSDLKGLGGAIQNFELQKTGSVSATWYKSRFYLRQTFDFGGSEQVVESGPLQLAGKFDSHRLVVTLGNLSVLDIFDKNAYAADLRQQFLNMAFLTHAAYDFAADARGYSVGAALEYYYADWALRVGRFATPQNPNDLPLDFRIFKYYGDQFELEHRHRIGERSGAAKLLMYRNYENMGRWQDAVAAYQANPAQNAAACSGYHYDSANTAAPDLCWVRRGNTKMGIGLNLEQQLADGVGVFLRGMYSDGKTEVYSYTSSDRSLSFGSVVNGSFWTRHYDVLGMGYAASWLSSAHVNYLNRGGVDGFIGDGSIRYRPEQVFDIYYKANLVPSVWLTLDYQRIFNPAYNSERGPVDIYGIRAHFEF